jgi:hypothetical protein
MSRSRCAANVDGKKKNVEEAKKEQKIGLQEKVLHSSRAELECLAGRGQ